MSELCSSNKFICFRYLITKYLASFDLVWMSAAILTRHLAIIWIYGALRVLIREGCPFETVFVVIYGVLQALFSLVAVYGLWTDVMIATSREGGSVLSSKAYYGTLTNDPATARRNKPESSGATNCYNEKREKA